jgi:hypothetical protein
MTLTRRIGLGFQLTASGISCSIVDGLTGPGAKADTVDISIITDTFKQFAKGRVDPGELSCMVAYDPADSTGQALAALLPVRTPVPTWTITYPDEGGGTSTQSFSAHLTGFELDAQVDKLVTAKITLKLTGDPGFAGD